MTTGTCAAQAWRTWRRTSGCLPTADGVYGQGSSNFEPSSTIDRCCGADVWRLWLTRFSYRMRSAWPLRRSTPCATLPLYDAATPPFFSSAAPTRNRSGISKRASPRSIRTPMPTMRSGSAASPVAFGISFVALA